MSLFSRFHRPDTTVVVDWALTTCFLIGWCCAHRSCPDPRPVRCAWRGGSVESGLRGKQNKQQKTCLGQCPRTSIQTPCTHTQSSVCLSTGALAWGSLGEVGGGRAREVMGRGGGLEVLLRVVYVDILCWIRLFRYLGCVCVHVPFLLPFAGSPFVLLVPLFC